MLRLASVSTRSRRNLDILVAVPHQLLACAGIRKSPSQCRPGTLLPLAVFVNGAMPEAGSMPAVKTGTVAGKKMSTHFGESWAATRQHKKNGQCWSWSASCRIRRIGKIGYFWKLQLVANGKPPAS